MSTCIERVGKQKDENEESGGAGGRGGFSQVGRLQVYNNLANYLRDQGRLGEARDAYERALVLMPRSGEVSSHKPLYIYPFPEL